MKTSDNGLNLIKRFEGCELRAYKDQRGIPTIGYGHTGPDVELGKVISQGVADQLLSQDLKNTEFGVNHLVTAPINQNQFDALVSFAYNCGLAALTRSTLLKQLNLKHYQEAANGFLPWCNAVGKQDPGLLRRRVAERELFLTPNAD